MCKRDMQTVGLREGNEGDRVTGKRLSTTIAATTDDGNSQRKRREETNHD